MLTLFRKTSFLPQIVLLLSISEPELNESPLVQGEGQRKERLV